jgi:hypothetical protein
MPERDELGHPDLVLGQDRLKRVMTAGVLVPGSQQAPPDPLPGRSTGCSSLGRRRWQITLGSR